jgi:hypothetical protein
MAKQSLSLRLRLCLLAAFALYNNGPALTVEAGLLKSRVHKTGAKHALKSHSSKARRNVNDADAEADDEADDDDSADDDSEEDSAPKDTKGMQTADVIRAITLEKARSSDSDIADPSMMNAPPPTTTTTTTTTTAAAPPPPPPPAPESHPWDALEAKLAVVSSRVSQLKSELVLWGDHAQWDAKISADKQALAAATTEALADMLADIRTELHQLAVPVYTDVLDENLEALLEKEAMLKQEIADMKAKVAKKPEEEPKPQAPAPLAKDAVANTDNFMFGAAFVVGILIVVAASVFMTKQ